MTEPATTAQLLQQGLFHHRQGDIAHAMERYTEVLRNDPHNADALYYVAVVACQDGQFQQGIELARRSLAFSPRQARAHNLIGQALHRLGQIKDALASFDDANAIRNSPRPMATAPISWWMPACTMRRSKASTAALALNPTSATDWLNRGATLQDLGRLDEALASYDKALALDPDFAVAHLNRATILNELGRWPDALAGYDRAIALAAQVAEAHSGRALALKGLGRLDEALAAADRAIELKPDLPVAHKTRASILQAMGRGEEARVSAERAAALEAQAPPAPSQGP